MIKKRRKILLCALLFVLFITIGFLIYGMVKNYRHNEVKKNVLNLIQEQIDKDLPIESYRAGEYVVGDNVYYGRVYVVNNNADMKFTKELLKHCRPIFKEYNYSPTDIHVFIGGVDIGYAGGSGHYYWDNTAGNNSYGFALSEKYDAELWDFLNSLASKSRIATDTTQ